MIWLSKSSFRKKSNDSAKWNHVEKTWEKFENFGKRRIFRKIAPVGWLGIFVCGVIIRSSIKFFPNYCLTCIPKNKSEHEVFLLELLFLFISWTVMVESWNRKKKNKWAHQKMASKNEIKYNYTKTAFTILFRYFPHIITRKSKEAVEKSNILVKNMKLGFRMRTRRPHHNASVPFALS